MNFNCLKLIIIVIATLFPYHHFIRAQDIHFSQVHSVPVFINPANTGVFDDDFRFANDYRNQWRQIDYPYQTIFLSADKKQMILGRMFGIGASVMHDQSSGTLISTDKIFVSLSHSFFYGQNQFVVGLQPGLVFRYLNSNELVFGSQFDPFLEKYNPEMSNNEDNLKDRTNYFDLNVGFVWQSKINNLRPLAGFSIHHVNCPKESFSETEGSKHLPMQFTFHGNIDIPLIQHFDISPLFYYSLMNGTNELMAGLITSYYPDDPYFAVEKVYLVSDLRSNPFINVDALIIGAGCKVLNFDICFTYDVTVSKLRKASNIQGAFEISLVYSNNPRKNKKRAEPCFML